MTKSDRWFYCQECGRTAPLTDMLTGDDCCLGVVAEEAFLQEYGWWV